MGLIGLQSRPEQAGFFWRLQGESFPAFSGFWGWLHSWVWPLGHISDSWPPCLPPTGALVMFLGALGNPGSFPPLKSLNFIPYAKSLFSWKVTFSQLPGIRMWTSLDGGIMLLTTEWMDYYFYDSRIGWAFPGLISPGLIYETRGTWRIGGGAGLEGARWLFWHIGQWVLTVG